MLRAVINVSLEKQQPVLSVKSRKTTSFGQIVRIDGDSRGLKAQELIIVNSTTSDRFWYPSVLVKRSFSRQFQTPTDRKDSEPAGARE